MYQYLQIKKHKEYIATKISVIRSIFSMFTWIPCDITSASVMMSIPTFEARSRESREAAKPQTQSTQRICEQKNVKHVMKWGSLWRRFYTCLLLAWAILLARSMEEPFQPGLISIEQHLYRKGNIVSLNSNHYLEPVKWLVFKLLNIDLVINLLRWLVVRRFESHFPCKIKDE